MRAEAGSIEEGLLAKKVCKKKQELTQAEGLGASTWHTGARCIDTAHRIQGASMQRAGGRRCSNEQGQCQHSEYGGGINVASRGSLKIVSSGGIGVASRQALTWQAGVLVWQWGIDVVSRGDINTASRRRGHWRRQIVSKEK
jgi:hypothetical protein